MPGPIVHLGASIMCMHGGNAQPAAPFPRVLVSGQPIVTQASPYIIAGCSLSGSAPPCVTAQWVVASLRVKAGGMPVIIVGSQAVCTPTGTGLIIAATQPRAIAT